MRVHVVSWEKKASLSPTFLQWKPQKKNISYPSLWPYGRLLTPPPFGQTGNQRDVWKKKKSFWSHIFKQNFIRHWQTRNEQKTINSWFFFFFICLTLLNIFYRLSGLGHKRRRAYIQSFLKLLLLYLTRRHDKHGKCFKKYVKSLLNKNNVYCCLLVCLYCCLLEKWQTSHF